MGDFPLCAHRNFLGFSRASSPTGGEDLHEASFGSDLVFILAALICALISGLGLTLLLRCALRCSRPMALHSSDEVLNTRLKKKAMKTLPIIVYTAASKPPGVATDCSICLGEFVEGEKVRVLPRCNHGFHLECIDKWFVSHSSCPLCRHSLNLHNQKPGGAAMAEGAELNNGMHLTIETTDSIQAVGVVPLSTETLEITLQETAQL